MNRDESVMSASGFSTVANTFKIISFVVVPFVTQVGGVRGNAISKMFCSDVGSIIAT